MKQSEIPLPAQAKALARSEHPEESKLAAEAILDSLGKLQRETLDAVELDPGKTARELGWINRLEDHRQFGRRLNELEKAGLVRRGAPRPCTRTGRKSATWYPLEKE